MDRPQQVAELLWSDHLRFLKDKITAIKFPPGFETMTLVET